MSFPTYTPSDRQIILTDFPIRKKRTLNGRSIRLIQGKFSTGPKLSLTFGGEAGLLDTEVAEIYNHWLDNFGIFTRITPPEAVFAGLSIALRGQFTGDLYWHYSKTPPVIVPTIPNRSIITVLLETSIDGL